MLVAVSKTKPVDMIIEAYNAGQRHFGENYTKELQEKATHQLILDSCPDIKWHFIGHLQRSNINRVINIPGLHMVETVDSEKLATALDKAWTKTDAKAADAAARLQVLIQINTSKEDAKSGITSSDVCSLYE